MLLHQCLLHFFLSVSLIFLHGIEYLLRILFRHAALLLLLLLLLLLGLLVLLVLIVLLIILLLFVLLLLLLLLLLFLLLLVLVLLLLLLLLLLFFQQQLGQTQVITGLVVVGVATQSVFILFDALGIVLLLQGLDLFCQNPNLFPQAPVFLLQYLYLSGQLQSMDTTESSTCTSSW